MARDHAEAIVQVGEASIGERDEGVAGWDPAKEVRVKTAFCQIWLLGGIEAGTVRQLLHHARHVDARLAFVASGLCMAGGQSPRRKTPKPPV